MKVSIKRRFFIFICLTFILPLPGALAGEQPAKPEYVLILHGMGRTKFSMRNVAAYLEEKGYKTINISYPSTKESIPVIAETHIKQAIETCVNQGAEKVHVVTHSLGGIVIRQYLQTHSLPQGSRVVMLGPPNKGSEVADFLMDLSIYKWIMGQAGQSLGTADDSFVNTLGPVSEDIGVIAGTRTIDPISSFIIPGPDDGKVSVESTMLDEMTDFIRIPRSHPFMASSTTILHQIHHFLKCGWFDPME